MSALAIYRYEDEQIRVVQGEHGEPWFVASDLARILGYRDAASLARRVPDEDRGTRILGTPGGDQEMTVLSEPGMYVGVLGSTVRRAIDFKKWVTHDVLPTIRQTGTYGTTATSPAALTKTDLARMVIESEAAREAAEARAAALAPRAAVADALIDTTGDYSLREAAQVLARDHGIDVGQNRLARELRRVGWIDLGRQPYQRQVDLGRLVRRATSYEHPKTGDRVSASQVRITAKGLADLHALLTCPESAPLALVGA